MEGRNLLEKYLAKFESNFETGIHVVNNIGLCITFSMMGFDWFSYFWTILRKEKKYMQKNNDLANLSGSTRFPNKYACETNLESKFVHQ